MTTRSDGRDWYPTSVERSDELVDELVGDGGGRLPLGHVVSFLRSTPVGSVSVFSPSTPKGSIISHTTLSAATSAGGDFSDVAARRSVAARFRRLVYPCPSSPFFKYRSWYLTSYRLSTMRALRSARSSGPLPRSSPLRTTCADHDALDAADANAFSAASKPSRHPRPVLSPTGSFRPSATSCIFLGGLFCSTKGAYRGG